MTVRPGRGFAEATPENAGTPRARTAAALRLGADSAPLPAV